MFFKGDLNKFYQPDLIMFLANLGKEGVLTVSHGDLNLNISISDGIISDTYSDRADGKILRSMHYRGIIDDSVMAKINQMKKETGMQVAHILEKMKLMEKKQILPEMKMAVREVLLQFFLMEEGKFQFLNVPVETDGQKVPCQGIVLDMAHEVDEWRDIEKSVGTLNQLATSRVPEKTLEKVPYPARHILAAATGRSLEEIIEHVPIYSFQALKLVGQIISKNLLKLNPPGSGAAVEKKASSHEALLQSFKKSYGHILEPKGDETRIDRLVAFCKYYFDKTAVFTVRADRVIACVSHMKDASGGIAKKENQGVDIPVTEEPIFSGVHRSGIAFFGRIDFSDAMGRLLDLPPSGECALLLVERSPEESQFLFALTAKESPNAIRYLKFFAEMMASAEEADGGSQLLPVSERASRLVSEVDDIPPMSHVVNRVLQLLSEPERTIEDIASVLSEDQAMVARIIRVSNSALYRSLQEVRGLNSAMTRMGLKAIRSILLSSATKDLLLSDKGAGGMWGRVLWQHAKECALASRRIAEQISYQDPEEAFVGGMLHDMGKMIILLKHQNLIPQIRKFQTAENLSSVEAERRVLGFSHSEIGGLLMQKWHMPEMLTHCVRHHHLPDASGEGGQLAWIVSYGNCLSNLHGLNESIGTTSYEKEIEIFRRHFSLEDAQAEAFEHMVTEDFKKSEIFD